MKSQQKSKEPSFEEWLVWAFDHTVSHPEWYWEDDAEDLEPLISAPTMVGYLTRLFADAPTHLSRFSHEQVAQGLWFVLNEIRDNHMFALGDRSVADDARQRCLDAMFVLYRDYFAKECPKETGEEHYTELNEICYMAWDIMPYWWVRLDGAEWASSCVLLLERILHIAHPVCQASALHGLGHFVMDYPDLAEPIASVINGFLKRNPALDPGLTEFAAQARRGEVL